MAPTYSPPFTLTGSQWAAFDRLNAAYAVKKELRS
jgi:hypothetical protein